jgi:hypothetical protein
MARGLGRGRGRGRGWASERERLAPYAHTRASEGTTIAPQAAARVARTSKWSYDPAGFAERDGRDADEEGREMALSLDREGRCPAGRRAPDRQTRNERRFADSRDSGEIPG